MPSKLLTIYFASTSWHAASSFVMIDTFFACEECPEVRAMSLKLEKTKGTVRGLGLKRVFWLFFEVYEAVLVRPGERISREGLVSTIATRPRSPSFLSSALMTEILRPVDSPIALMSRLSPIPSSTPT